MKPHYSEEEANDILRRAIEQMPVKTEMSREQLESIASEIGLNAEALRKAETDLAAERTDKAARRAFVASRRQGWLRHLLAFAVTMAMLFAFNIDAQDAVLQAAFVTAGIAWGIALAVHARTAFRTRGLAFEVKFAEWRHIRCFLDMTDDKLLQVVAAMAGANP